MNFTGLSATAIWASPVRNLTGFSLNTLIFFSNVNTSLAANATVAFQPAINRCGIVTIAGVADASGTVVIRFVDGTNAWNMQTIAAGTTGGQDVSLVTTGAWSEIHNNSGTVAAHFLASGYVLIQ